MTMMKYTICAEPYEDNGLAVIHMYIGNPESTHTDSPGEERRAIKDANQIIGDIVRKNCDGENTDKEQLLQEGNPPWNALPIFVFAVGVSWNSEWKMPHYSRIGYRTICGDSRYAAVYQVGMDLYDYTMDVLRKRERTDREKVSAPKLKNDRVTQLECEQMFARWCDSLVPQYAKGVAAHEANNRRFGCDHYRNGYCVSLEDGTPPNFKCPCFKNGKCEEI